MSAALRQGSHQIQNGARLLADLRLEHATPIGVRVRISLVPGDAGAHLQQVSNRYAVVG